ncbi:polysaccharide pyruvyl transferase family protein, partial [Parasutterella secunda]|uniref:polysaccharide pyruvyl transferase family protein n=1 Tax=Parasutterella secunda TaxID=626947 RepID=UPI0025A3D4A7
TLTLNRNEFIDEKEHGGGLIFVDPYYPQFMSKKSFFCNVSEVLKGFFRIFKYLKFTTNMNSSRKFRHEPTVLSKISPQIDQLWCIAQFYHVYRRLFSDSVLLNARYITHSVPRADIPTQEKSFDYTKKLLKKYVQADLVITSRIHCALPCLALKTPVIFVNSSAISEIRSPGRLEGLINLFHIMDFSTGNLHPDSYLATKFPHNSRLYAIPSIENKPDYIEIRKNLIKLCQRFMSNP